MVKLDCPWLGEGVPPCDWEKRFDTEDPDVEGLFMSHVAKKHNEHTQEAALISQGMGAGGITAVICNNPMCLQHQFFTLPIIIAWILFPLYILRVKAAFIVGALLSLVGIILTFAFPSILGPGVVRTWYCFTDPVRDVPFVMLQIIFVTNMYTSYKTYKGKETKEHADKINTFYGDLCSARATKKR